MEMTMCGLDNKQIWHKLDFEKCGGREEIMLQVICIFFLF